MLFFRQVMWLSDRWCCLSDRWCCLWYGGDFDFQKAGVDIETGDVDFLTGDIVFQSCDVVFQTGDELFHKGDVFQTVMSSFRQVMFFQLFTRNDGIDLVRCVMQSLCDWALGYVWLLVKGQLPEGSYLLPNPYFPRGVRNIIVYILSTRILIIRSIAWTINYFP